MNKIITIATITIIASTTAHAALNCCAKCPYHTDDTACTTNCCLAKYGSGYATPSYSAPDANGVITVKQYTETVTCATSSTDTNIVSCLPSTTYTCAAGYYGTPTLLNKTCNKCATTTGHPSATTADRGATQITECYIPAGTAFSDTTGSGTYSENCNYAE
ncbi:MAG: hypothetical protein NC311_03630 [Muribaculaceae bacterium]|nr:hypothetical protein [Muribaculaceae bacterium]